MAGKKKKKEKRKPSSSLSHIGSHLVPSAIFAATPRSASPLSSTWPRSQSKTSPITQAVGSAGTIGWAFVGDDLNRTSSSGNIQRQTSPAAHCPPANLPSSSSAPQQPVAEDSTYEDVNVGSSNYDRTASRHVSHKTNDEDNFKSEPVYAKVDKSKKKSSLTGIQDKEHGMNDYDDVADDASVISSDDELTDVTSNDEESSSRNSQKGKKADTKHLKVRREEDEQSEEQSDDKVGLFDLHDGEDKGREGIEASCKKRSNKRSIHLSKKRNSIDTVDDESSGPNNHDITDGKTSPDSTYGNPRLKRGSKKSSLKKRSQVAPGEELESTNSENPDKEGRQLERLGFEGTSQRVGLSDISEDEEGYPLKDLKTYPNSKVMDPRTKLNEVIVHEEIQISENKVTNVSAPYPNSLFDESPEENLERSGNLSNSNDSKSANLFTEQQKQLEHLIRQQESVYRQQAEQQKEQQQQTEKLVQQQLELQKHLQHLEEMQGEKTHSPPGTLSIKDIQLQRDVVEQQENLLRLQQQQQAKYDRQQERVLKQQEKICDQIRELEFQQKELQSNLSSLSPKETDLSEICWQEKEIIRLLNEQQTHQQKYEKLHRLQQEQFEQQALKFQQDRQVLELQQNNLQTKIQEQEEKSKKLEIELQNISAKEKIHPKKTRQHNTNSDSEEIQSSQLDQVDAIPVSETQAPLHNSQRLRNKNKTSTKRSLNHVDVLKLENSRLSDLNVSLQKENKVLKQVSETLEKGSGGSSLITQQYIKDLQQEIKVLQDTVHRLNVELSRYQLKYRQASLEEVDSFLFPKTSTGSCSWLVNTKFLAPLFVAYDDRLKERDDIINIYDEEMNAFKGRLLEIVKENQDLHMRLAKSKPDALDSNEWQQLQEQAKLVVEENTILMKQQELQHKKIKEMQQMHGQDVSKLSMRITKIESEKKSLVSELEVCHCSHAALLQKYNQLAKEEEKKIFIQEHLTMMDDFRSLMEDMKEKKQLEMEEMESKIQAIQTEKQGLASKLTDSKAHIAQLTNELDVHIKTQRKLERKTLLLEKKLEHILEREVTAQQALSDVLIIAEKTAEERDNFEEFARTQKMKRKKSKSLLQQGDMSILGLQEKLKSNKRKSSERVALITDKLNEKEKQVNKIKADHEREINKLRGLVREKQKYMEDMLGQRRMFDQQLDEVWRKADKDNQQMRKTIEESHVARSTDEVLL